MLKHWEVHLAIPNDAERIALANMTYSSDYGGVIVDRRRVEWLKVD